MDSAESILMFDYFQTSLMEMGRKIGISYPYFFISDSLTKQFFLLCNTGYQAMLGRKFLNRHLTLSRFIISLLSIEWSSVFDGDLRCFFTELSFKNCH